MNIVVTTFSNPFSFYCMACEDNVTGIELLKNNESISSSKVDMSDVNHGQYVAVLWKGKWTRGIVTMESQFLIWLIDFGIYVRPNEKTVYVELPAEYKKHPTKVFEASLHGVVPVDRVLTVDCQITNEVSIEWSKGAIEKAKTLIDSASQVHFVPVALLSTKSNDIVLGDMYLSLPSNEVVNLIEELKKWPVFLQSNSEIYTKNLESYYTTRRRHRACLLKPDIPTTKLPTLTLDTTLQQYKELCAQIRPLVTTEFLTDSEDGSSVASTAVKCHTPLALSSEEIEQFSELYVTINGREYNMLNILLNKMRDLKMCELYKDHDTKGAGRATTRKHKY